jgi:hypothetical protein
VYARLYTAYVGCQPATGETPAAIRLDGPVGDGWELLELTPHAYGVIARFVEADRGLAIEPNGTLSLRPAGTATEWETLQTATLPGGGEILYRLAAGAIIGSPLTIEAA